MRHLNSVGQAGVYIAGDPSSVAMSGPAIARRRTFQDAASSSQLANGDAVGVSVTDASDDSAWINGIATWADGVLTIDVIEDSRLEMTDGADVVVEAVITARMLDEYANRLALTATSEGAGATQIHFYYEGSAAPAAVDGVVAVQIQAPPATAYDGPDYWSISSTGTTWDASDGHYVYDGLSGSGQFWIASEGRAWATDFRPSSVSVDMYIPSGASIDAEYINLKILESYNGDYLYGDAVGSGYAEGAWITLTCDLSALPSDIYAIRLDSMSSDTFYIKNILFAP